MVTNMTQETRGRLIVLIPEGIENQMDLARRIHWMAHRMAARKQRDVLYFALLEDGDREAAMLRWLATMKAATRDGFLAMDAMIVAAQDWVKELQAVVQPGDMVVCHAEQTVKQGWGKTTPLHRFLQDQLHLEVSVVDGYYRVDTVQVKPWMRSLLFWAGCLVTLIFFTVLEIRVDQSLQNANFARPIIVLLLVCIETGTIWAWNVITGK